MSHSKKSEKQHPWKRANILSRIFFCWLQSLLSLGHKEGLSLADLYGTPPTDSSAHLGDQLEREWDKEIRKSKESKSRYQPSLTKAMVQLCGTRYLIIGLFLLLSDCVMRTYQTKQLAQVVSYFEEESDMTIVDAAVCGATGVIANLLTGFLSHLYMFQAYHLGMRLRIACSTLVYRKAVRFRGRRFSEYSSDEAIARVSGDISRMDSLLVHLHFLWVSPAQITLRTISLWSQFGPATFVGIGVILFYNPFQGLMGLVFSRLQSRIPAVTKQRMSLIRDFLVRMKLTKMNSCESLFERKVRGVRKQEVQLIHQVGYWRAVNRSVSLSHAKIVLLLTFFTYSTSGKMFDARKLFMAIVMYNNIRSSLNQQFSLGCADRGEVFNRINNIQKFLLDAEGESKGTEDKMVVTAGLSVRSFSLLLRPGQLIIITGPPGSGKSHLLQAMALELCSVSAEDTRNQRAVSLAPQTPWIFPGSVWQNVVMSRGQAVGVDRARLDKVLRISGLDKDIAQLIGGEEAEVGGPELELTTDQRARVSLARALYKDADIYLLDEPFALMDTQAASEMYEDCIVRYLRARTRVVVTTQYRYLKSADLIVLVSQGRVLATGKFKDLLKRHGKVLSLLATEEDAQEDEDEGGEVLDLKPRKERRGTFTKVQPSSVKKKKKKDRMNVKIRYARESCLKFYAAYFRCGANRFLLSLMSFLLILTHVLYYGSDYWLALWADVNEMQSLRVLNVSSRFSPLYTESRKFSDFAEGSRENEALFVYAGMVLMLILSSTISYSFLFKVGVRASYRLHKRMLKAVLAAPLSMLTRQTIGELFNSFRIDIRQLDEVIPAIISDTIETLLGIFGVMLLVVLTNYWLASAIVIFVVIFFWISGRCLRTLRDLRKLEENARTSVYEHFKTTLQEVLAIKAFQVEQMFENNFEACQDMHSSAWFLLHATQSGIAVWFDLVCAFNLGIVVLGFFLLPQAPLAGNIALALSSALTLSGLCEKAMRLLPEVLSHSDAISTVISKGLLKPEDEVEISGEDIPSDWPRKGSIQIEKVRLGDEKDVASSLFSCDIRAGERVGIVVQTREQMNSLLSALFKLSPIEGIVKLDNIYSSDVSARHWRRQLSIVTREPIAISRGSLRENLDPDTRWPDERLWKVLELVELKDIVEKHERGLYLPMDNSANCSFTVSQLKRVDMARMLLKQSKVLILEEATATVDPGTASWLRDMLKNPTNGFTVVWISRTPTTLGSTDRVLFIEHNKQSLKLEYFKEEKHETAVKIKHPESESTYLDITPWKRPEDDLPDREPFRRNSTWRKVRLSLQTEDEPTMEQSNVQFLLQCETRLSLPGLLETRSQTEIQREASLKIPRSPSRRRSQVLSRRDSGPALLVTSRRSPSPRLEIQQERRDSDPAHLLPAASSRRGSYVVPLDRPDPKALASLVKLSAEESSGRPASEDTSKEPS